MIGIPVGITSSPIELKICVIATGIKKCMSVIKKKKKKHYKIVSLAKSNLNSIEVLTSKALVDSNINLEEFVLINNMLKECERIKE